LRLDWSLRTSLAPYKKLEKTTILELTFVSEIIRDICYNEDQAKAMLGEPVALALKRRLADIRAEEFVTGLLAGTPKEIIHNGSPAYKLNLSTQDLLIFCSGHTPSPTFKDGRLDWHQVSRVKLIQIGPIC